MKNFIQYIKTRKKYVIVLTLAISLVSFSFTEDYYFEVSKNLDIFTTLFRDVNIYYVDSVQPGELMKTGIDAMMKSLDPYSVYVPESDIEDYRMTHVSAEYGGIGALVHERGDAVEISEVYEGFPAQKGDIRPGDIVLSVNGQSVKGKKVDDVTDVLKGAKGSKVTLSLKREGMATPIEKTLYRDEIKFKNVPYYGMADETTGYIRLSQFLENAGDEVKDALTMLKQNPKMKQVVLDLRGNGGGLLKEAVNIVNLFVDKGQKIVSQKGKVKEMNAEYVAMREAVDKEIPVAVLVDKGSASASEIVTGAMQELDRGVVIGTRTFGKGLVQQTYPLSYNTLLKVTIAKYFTPSGRCVQAVDYSQHLANGKLSPHKADSLFKEFKTKNGRSVYDGSGVYPDVYLGHESYSNVTAALAKNFLLFDYANKYFREHRSIDSAKAFKLTDTEYNQFIAWLSDKKYEYTNKSEKMMEDLQKRLEKEQYLTGIQNEFTAFKKKMADAKKQDLQNHRDEIKEVLEGQIASRYYYQRGALEAGMKYDKELKKASEVLSTKELYSSILAGQGQYKIIGKPGTTEQALTGSESEDFMERE
jgi:carboxyl-terminal processing protease